MATKRWPSRRKAAIVTLQGPGGGNWHTRLSQKQDFAGSNPARGTSLNGAAIGRIETR